MQNISTVKFVLKSKMRYETLGDWMDDGTIELYSEMTSLQKLAIGVHELVEMILCNLTGLTQTEVDQFDTGSLEGNKADPQMYDKDPRYKLAHEAAEQIERFIVETAGIDWDDYNKALDEIQINYYHEPLQMKDYK